MAAKFKTHADLPLALEDKLATGLPNLIRHALFTPIDILSLSDKTFLHEVSHRGEKIHESLQRS